MLVTPYMCAQHHSSTVASACYMSRAILLRCRGEIYLNIGLELVRAKEDYKSQLIYFIR